MAQDQPVARSPGVTYAVSNTGPLISAFQSDSFALLTEIFSVVHVPAACESELIEHGWEEELRTAKGRLTTVELAPSEQRRALTVARQIARHPATNDPVAQNHLGEAQAIVLALRPEHHHDILLLDELAARAVAKHAGIRLSGFPGILLLAAQLGLITAEDLKTRLEKCRAQGTYYGVVFIRQVYEMARGGRRKL